jgi:hypothetical protein
MFRNRIIDLIVKIVSNFSTHELSTFAQKNKKISRLLFTCNLLTSDGVESGPPESREKLTREV